MEKDAMNDEISKAMDTIRDHSEKVTKLLSQLSVVMRSDVALQAIDDSKELLAGVSDFRLSMEKVKRALKARALTRMKDL